MIRIRAAEAGAISEAAQVAARLACAMPAQARRDARDMLGLTIRASTPARRREARLGLLVELVDATGEVPTGERYDALRTERVLAGEVWPDRTALARAYGHWLLAVRAAMRHWQLGGRTKGPTTDKSAGPYNPQEAIDGLRRCRDALGPWPSEALWPTEWEYETYRQLARAAARQAGAAYPRVPCLPVVRKLFGDYARFVAHARGRDTA